MIAMRTQTQSVPMCERQEFRWTEFSGFSRSGSLFKMIRTQSENAKAFVSTEQQLQVLKSSELDYSSARAHTHCDTIVLPPAYEAVVFPPRCTLFLSPQMPFFLFFSKFVM